MRGIFVLFSLYVADVQDPIITNVMVHGQSSRTTLVTSHLLELVAEERETEYRPG
jgi:hypothetical protein